MKFKSLWEAYGYDPSHAVSERDAGKLYLSLRLQWSARVKNGDKLNAYEGDNGIVISINKDEDPGEAMHVELMEYIKSSLINDKGIDPEADGECTMAIVDFGDVTVL